MAVAEPMHLTCAVVRVWAATVLCGVVLVQLCLRSDRIILSSSEAVIWGYRFVLGEQSSYSSLLMRR